MHSRQNAALLAAGLLAIVGCSRQPEIGQVEGLLTLDGRPVANALVVFQPETPPMIQSTGVTDEAGRFRLWCNDQRDGALVGMHRVYVVDSRRFAVTADKDADEIVPITVTDSPRIPPRYASPENSPLRQEVARGSQSVTIEMTSKPR